VEAMRCGKGQFDRKIPAQRRAAGGLRGSQGKRHAKDEAENRTSLLVKGRDAP